MLWLHAALVICSVAVAVTPRCRRDGPPWMQSRHRALYIDPDTVIVNFSGSHLGYDHDCGHLWELRLELDV